MCDTVPKKPQFLMGSICSNDYRSTIFSTSSVSLPHQPSPLVLFLRAIGNEQPVSSPAQDDPCMKQRSKNLMFHFKITLIQP